MCENGTGYLCRRDELSKGIFLMKTEKEIRERITLLEERDNPDADEYLDESEAAQLYTLMWVVGDMDDY